MTTQSSFTEEVRNTILEQLTNLEINCFYDRVIVIPDATETKTKMGIIIPDTVQEKPKKGTVVFCGPDCEGTDSPEIRPNCTRIKPGDRVIYGKYAGSEMKLNGVDIVVMRESDIFFNFGKSVDVYIEM